MDPQLQALYARIKARQISPVEAAAQLKLWQAQHHDGLGKENALETVQAALIQAASRVLKVDPGEIDGDVELHEYGFDQVKMTELCSHVSEAYSIALTPELLCEYRTLHGIARYLVEACGATAPSFVPDGAVADPLRASVTDYLKKLLSSSLKIPVQSIDAHAAMEQYGLNSVLVMALTNQLEEVFGSLPKTLFFEYQSLDELTAYFLECHGDTLKELLHIEARVVTPALPESEPMLAAELRQPQRPTTGSERRQRQRFIPAPRVSGSQTEVCDVAIVGLSGRYPGAENLAQFWDNLKAGRNCITEIPPDRWDWRAYFDAEKAKLGSMYTKWGGFLSDIDKFDPLFFHISPAEAQNMDPQERLFIEEAYAAIEDAGYTPATLGEHGAASAPSERKIGVFVGVMNSTYAPNTRYWSMANRVSYLFDFQGPSIAVDTACSASLTAIHLALESLYHGTCTCAIAGGVNLIVDPVHYLGLSVLSMLSPTDQCKAFGAQADGFVDGEGVGALVLKPLSRALEDNDHIYGVLKGSMVNAGGKTNGYTVPNPKAQARLIAEACQRAGVNPRTVSYVEAHGTGTALGDPIEIAGLTRAFAQATGTAHSRDTQFCRIGSVKSNIGHLESASGIAGVTKVLLQLQHRQLVPSLHAKILNPSLDLEHSPFVVQQELAAWPRPRLEMDGATREYPRIAGISSFGAGGANAHLIIAEYITDREDEPRLGLPNRPALIMLSAKQEEGLKERARRLLAVLQEAGRVWSDRDLADMAYTLQVGREAMAERLALIVRSPAELAEKLAAFLAGHDNVADVFRGRAGGTAPGSIQQDLSLFASDEDLQLALAAWIAKGKYDTLLSLWVKGLAVDWDKLHRDDAVDARPEAGCPRRISLPTYPFAKERYWAHDSTRGTRAEATPATLHPLLHHNTSDLTAQRFSTTLSGREFFLADHVVRGQKVLPAVAYLEMVREALHRAAGSLQEGLAEVRLENVVWTRPLVVGETPVEVHIGLFPEEPGREAERSIRIAYEIYSRDGGAAAVVYSQGQARLCAARDTRVLDLAALQAQCDQGGFDADQCYAAFAAMGLNYGAGHRGIQRLSLGSDQVLAKLVLPDQLRDTADRFVLHPSLMDAALQAALGLLGQSSATVPASAAEAPGLALPFALRDLSISGACTTSMWAWVRYAGASTGEGLRPAPTQSRQGPSGPAPLDRSPGQATQSRQTQTVHDGVRDLDIDVCDDSGAVRVRLRGFSLRVLGMPGDRADTPPIPTFPHSGGKGNLPTPVSALAADVAQAKTAAYLTHLIASAIGLPAHRLDIDASLEKYGMDSVMAMQLTMQLEKTFGPLSKTLFFEYQDIRTLSDYFLASHPDQLQAVLGLAPDVAPAPDGAVAAAAPAMPASNRRRPRFAALQHPRETASADIAVIGLAGRYPKANTLDEFWDNLRTGRDCITEIPAERWDHAHYFDPDKSKVGKVYSKWGGFLDDVDRFDPLFFNIAPRDAEIMDPQERLFLECVWHLLENAGHTRALLRAHYQSRVGVYVGAMYQPYHAFDSDLLREAAIAVSSYYAIANRVSYFLDLQGPSMAIDTACSSALVAVHMACESLRQGECQLAITGGVNLSIHPKKYLGLSLAQIIGSHADSRSFGDGDGYIPAEGVGAVLLKPLTRAVRDQDAILAVIKSSAINHSGHTHGYAVPNPNAQAQLMIDNFTKSGIDPRTISYVEAAANGSALGDAIEFNAMHKAFREFTGDQGFCAIGSVKSNIGHAEAASGLSQLTKVLLQLQHGLLAPSIKAEPLNPNLSFDGSPFYLQRELCEWRRPVLDGIGECPRRATVSAIGAGGSNAHLIVEEYVAPAGADTVPAVVADAPQVVVLSATSWDRLRAVVERMLAFVRHNPGCALAHLTYTLQTGREAMATRLAMVVASRDELVRGLEEFLQIVATDPHVEPGALNTSVPMFSGDLEGDRAELRNLLSGKAGEAIVQVFLAERNLEKLALHWTQGGDIPWDALHAGMAVRQIALPNYPFARQRYWIQESARQDELAAAAVPVAAQAAGGETAGDITPESFSALSTHDRIRYFLTAVLSEELGIPMDEITLHKTFQDYGADSIAVLKMTRGFEEIFHTKLSGRETLEHPTVAALSRYLTDKLASQLPLVTEPARHSRLVDWNATQRYYPQHQCLHQLFEAQVERTPDAVAAVWEEAQITYRELNRRANRLAHHLREVGVGPEVLVGIHVERSLDMLIGLLGILKAGGAYVPLDPSYPQERLAFMLTDARVDVLLTQQRLITGFPNHTARVVVLDGGDRALDPPSDAPMADAREENLSSAVTADNLAYVMYTSGSTGTPKGVLGLQRGTLNRLFWMWERFPFGVGEVYGQKTALSFVDSVWEIFGPLLRGIRIVIIPTEVVRDPQRLVQTLAERRVTRILLVPSLLGAILDTSLDLQRQLSHLRQWITESEVLSPELCQRFVERLPGCTLLNIYGASEVSADATWYDATQSAALPCVPIGHPLANMSVYVLDPHQQPVPVGELGELHIGGVGLSRGYHKRPALTAQKFIPNPFAAPASPASLGARLYKTGDLGRYGPDGTLEFLGRIDHQVKIRGYRIELGEIETVLAGHPGVAQAAAIAIEAGDDKRIVGYVAAKPGHALEPHDLRHYLSQKLPEYMMPFRFVVLERMPLTPSGKIARLALPVPPKLDGPALIPPRDDLERQLAQIWEELLDIGQVGIQDDFFTLGGHSLLAIRLLARIRDRFGTELPFATLQQAPTIQGLAEILRGDQQVRDFSHLVALEKGTKRPFFCVPGVGGTVFYFIKLASLLGRDQPFYGLQARGLDGETVPYTSVEEMARHYVQAIQTVQAAGPYLLGGHSFGGYIAFEMAMQLEAMGHEVGAVVLIDCAAPATLNLRRAWNASALFLAFASILGIRLKEHPDLVCKLLGNMDTDAKLAIIYDAVIKLDAFPLPIDMSQFRGIFQVYLTNNVMQYRPTGRLDSTRITLLAARVPYSEVLLSPAAFAQVTNDAQLLQHCEDISAAWAEYDQELRRLYAEDAHLGWGRFTTRPIEVRHVSGNHIDMLSEPHIHVLAALLQETLQAAHTSAAPSHTQPVAVAPYPLSKVQEGLWLLHKFSPHMSAYNVPVALHCPQGFKVDMFRRACAFLLDQYPMLSSLFVEVDGAPRQYIPAQRRCAFEHEVIDHLDERDVMPFLREKVKQPFDLAQGPLMRVHLCSRGHGPQQDHIALITMHHIVFDGTSSILLASTLMSAYHALIRGEEPKPMVPEASYQDFVHWEQVMLASPEGREHLAWWQQQLAGELPVLALRTDYPRPAVRGFSGATLEALLDPALSAQLKALARSQRVSLSTLLLAIYKILLHRYTAQADLIVGMPTMGRPKQIFDRVMGCFINMMAVRSRVSGDQSFIDYLKTLQLIMLDSLDHAVYPFSELVRELQVERDQSISPIFQTYYTYQNYGTSVSEETLHGAHTGALYTEFLRGIHQEGDKDLGLEVYEEPAHFTLNLKYNPDLYKATTMQRLLEHFTCLAMAVVQQPYGTIAGYDVFSAEQKTAMLRHWNHTDRAFPKAQLLFQLFAEQAAKTPDHTAVVYKDQALTYGELGKRSSKLAAYLQQRGVGPETFVGLYLPRCLEIVVGAVGILKAGGVYVPLDPALPEERLAYMIEDAHVAFLLTTTALASQAQAFQSRVAQLEVLDLDQDWPAISRCRAVNAPALQPENLAYVIYTSGSTGRPKGVMIPHSTTTRHCDSIRDYFRMAPGTRVCLQSPISFDASIEQIFAPLSTGATVAIRDLEVLEPKSFSAMLADLQVNIVQLPPAFILALFREWQLHPELISTALKLIISCGDVLAVETVRLWQAMLKDRVTLLNVYGPTEVTAKATWHQIDPDLDTANLARIPIGRPLANKKVYLLDHYTHPTPIGVPGELHVGGTGPGRGYHGRPALTAEKFMPDPFSDAPGARLYKTGDLAYYRDDGTIEFLGRMDYQVKVRGHRIELGEIEAVLAGHPGVKNAAVISVDRGDDRRIVAYLVAQEGHALDQADLKACLGRQLPDYMVPSAFVCLDQMPLTPSGKINRRALPLPEGMQREGTVAPRDTIELELARIWEEVLAVQSVDIRQDFFELGGHSLLAIRLMVLIEERMGQDLPLATLFQAPTIEQLAAVLRQADAGSETTIVPLQALGTQPPFFCVPGAGGTVLYLNELAHHLGQDQPFYAFQAQGLDGRSAPYTSVPQIANRYIQAMRTVQPQGPYLLGGHSFGGRVAFEMAHILERMGQHVQQLVLLDCVAPQPEEQGHAWDDTSLLIAFAGALGLDIGSHVDLVSGIVAEQELDHQIERLLRALKQHNLVLPDIQSRRFKGLFQVFNTNNQMTYVPDGPINAPITLFKASDVQPKISDSAQFRQVIDDPAVLSKIEAMHRTWAQFNERLARSQEDAHLGWDRYTTATVTAYDVPGDHMSLVRDPHARTLSRAMRACLGG